MSCVRLVKESTGMHCTQKLMLCMAAAICQDESEPAAKPPAMFCKFMSSRAHLAGRGDVRAAMHDSIVPSSQTSQPALEQVSGVLLAIYLPHSQPWHHLKCGTRLEACQIRITFHAWHSCRHSGCA